jgi:hypothetical protein
MGMMPGQIGHHEMKMPDVLKNGHVKILNFA